MIRLSQKAAQLSFRKGVKLRWSVTLVHDERTMKEKSLTH